MCYQIFQICADAPEYIENILPGMLNLIMVVGQFLARLFAGEGFVSIC